MGRIPASERTRERLKALMDGQSEEGDLRSALVRLAARLILEEGLEGEATDATATRSLPALTWSPQRMPQGSRGFSYYACHFCLAATSIFLKNDTQDPVGAIPSAATGRAA